MVQVTQRSGMVTRHPWWRQAGIVFASTILGCVLASAGALSLGGYDGGHVALACGLGASQTMLANSTPAVLFPTVNNTTPPVPGLFADDYAVKSAVTFGEDLSRMPNAPSATSLQWKWTFGDGTTTTGSATPAHTYSKPGNFIITSYFYSTQEKQWVQFDGAQLHVVASLPPNPPVARITETTPMAIQSLGQSIAFDASKSTSSDGSPLSYSWNFNDGTTATGVQVTHQFAVPGQGFISLTVTDGRGAKGTATINVTVPQQELGVSAPSATPGRQITFSESTADASSTTGQTLSYTWHFDDGTPDQSTSQPTISHAYAHAGEYAVTMQTMAPQGMIVEGVWVRVVAPATPPWRYYAGGAAVALGIIISLLAAVRAQRRQIALAEQRKASRARRASAADRSYAGRAGRYGSRDDSRRGGYGHGSSARNRSPGGSSGRWDEAYEDDRRRGSRQGAPRRGRAR
jgi:PKD repeat protein